MTLQSFPHLVYFSIRSPADIPLVFTRVQAVYQEEVDSSVDTNEKVSIAVSSSVIVLMVLVAALYTIPSFVKLDRERIGCSFFSPHVSVVECFLVCFWLFNNPCLPSLWQPSSPSSPRSPKPLWGS